MPSLIVITGLDPVIHAFSALTETALGAGMAGSRSGHDD
jgi:hypothetical protein